MEHVNAANFEEEVLKSDIPVIVDFFAEWCGPCKRMEPILTKVSGGFTGKVKVVKINSDENQPVALKYRVQGLPTLVVFRGGQEVDRKLGFQNEGDLNKLLTSLAG